MKTTTKIACAYCRVSTDLEEQKKSITEQQKQWIEFFEENKMTIAEVGCLCHREIIGTKADGTPKKGKLIVESRNDGLYVDEGISGTSLKNRKAFQRMVTDAKLGKFDTIFVEDISRFTRSMEDGLQVIKDLREIGVSVYFKKEGLDASDTTKEFELQLRISIAQEESRLKSARMKWAMKRLHSAGGWNSVAPYGYDIVDGFLRINEKQSKIVQLIYQKYTREYWGIGKICRSLNEFQNEDGSIGIPAQKGGQWSQIQIRRILENQIYRGEYRTHTIETDDITRHTKKKVPESEWITCQKEELRIIDDETFYLAQTERERRNKIISHGNGISTAHLLSTVLRCAYCGASFKRKKRHTYTRKDGTSKEIGYEWTCTYTDMYGTTKKSKGGKCSGGRNALIEEDVIEAIKYDIRQLQTSSFDASFKMYLSERFKNVHIKEKEELEKQLSDLNGEMRILRQDRRDQLISEDVYSDQMKTLNEEIASVKAKIERIDRLEDEKRRQQYMFSLYKEELASVDVNNLTNSDLKNIYHSILVRYTVDGNGKKHPYLRFVYRFMDTTSDDLLEKSGSDANIKVYTPLYLYRTAKEIDDLQ